MGWVVRRSEGKAVRGSCPDLLGGTAHPIHAAPARSVNPQRSAFIGVHRRPIIKALSQLEVLVSDGTLILAAEAEPAAGSPVEEAVDGIALARLYGEPLFALPTDLYIPP